MITTQPDTQEQSPVQLEHQGKVVTLNADIKQVLTMLSQEQPLNGTVTGSREQTETGLIYTLAALNEEIAAGTEADPQATQMNELVANQTFPIDMALDAEQFALLQSAQPVMKRIQAQTGIYYALEFTTIQPPFALIISARPTIVQPVET
ncbi:MAG: hypothetical protein Q8O99_00730 [bacterium]|nr:hypothetical protein [bacterium]